MKTILLLAAMALAGCAPICPLEAAKDETMACEVGFTTGRDDFVCTQWARHRSLMTKLNKFGE